MDQGLVYNVAEPSTYVVKIKVIGIGGGGCNAINNMMKRPLKGVEYISANTDVQSLNQSTAHKRIQLGINLTKGLGAGANPEKGKNAALESREQIADAIRGANMLFITTGMGGGTGTGGAGVVAEIAREMEILTVAVVTRPFKMEGKRVEIARQGIEELKEKVDSIIVVPNDNLTALLGKEVSVREAFSLADDVLAQAVTGIYDMVTHPGLVNIDFADVRTVMGIKGMAMMGSAVVAGEDRARLATEQAISNPFLDSVSLSGAKGIIFCVTTAPGALKIYEFEEVSKIIDEYVHPDAERKGGLAEDENLNEDELRVTIIATDVQSTGSGEHEKAMEMLDNLQTGTDMGSISAAPQIKVSQSYQQPQATPQQAGLQIEQASPAPQQAQPQQQTQGQQQQQQDDMFVSSRKRMRQNLRVSDFQNPDVLREFETPSIFRNQAD